MKLDDWFQTNLGVWRLTATKEVDSGAILQLE
jgi:hypothetical protein